MGADVGREAAGAGDRGLLLDEIGEEIARRSDDDVMACIERAICDVPEKHRLADAVRAEEDDVRAFGDEVEGEELFDEGSVDLSWPLPIVAADGFERADTREMLAVREA